MTFIVRLSHRLVMVEKNKFKFIYSNASGKAISKTFLTCIRCVLRKTFGIGILHNLSHQVFKMGCGK